MSALRGLALLPLLLAGGKWEVVPGPRFDVWSTSAADRARYSPVAEDVGQRFEDLFVEFPGVRAAVILRRIEIHRKGDGLPPSPPSLPDPPGPEWKKGCVTWSLEFQPGAALRFPTGVAEIPRNLPEIFEEDGFRMHLAEESFRHLVAERTGGSLPEDGYGSPLPDWLDAACRGYHRVEASRSGALSAVQFRLQQGRYIPLDELFTMAIPKWLPPPDLPGTPGGKGGGSPAGDSEAELHRWMDQNWRADGFQDQSESVLEFLVESYGAPFVRQIVDVHCRNLGFSNVFPWLKRNAKDLRIPGGAVPETISDLEKAWLAWVRAWSPAGGVPPAKDGKAPKGAK